MILAEAHKGAAFRGASLPPIIELDPADSIAIRVIDSEGQPATCDVMVEGRIPLLSTDGLPPSEASWLQTLVHTDSQVSLPACLGTGTILARSAEGKAAWSGTWPDPGSAIVLTIGESIDLFGKIADMPPGRQGAQVYARYSTDTWDAKRFDTEVGGDGTWRLSVVPPPGEEDIVVTFQHPEAELDVASVSFSTWSSGSAVPVGFTWNEAIPLQVEVRDEFTNERVPYPIVSVQWSTEAGWQKRVIRGEADGFAHLPSAPRGQAWVRFLREGYSNVAQGPFALPAQRENWVWIPAIREASLAVRVTRDGRALARVTIRTFEPGGETETTEVDLDEDGRVRIEGLPRGAIYVQALAMDGALSPIVQVDLKESAEASTELAVAPLAFAHGRIIDRRTGKTLAGAHVRSIVRGPGGRDRGDLGSVQSDASGHFRALPIAPGGSTVRATHGGYSQRSRRVRARTDSAGPFDVGVIALEKELSLSLRLESQQSLDATQFEFAPTVAWLNQERQPFPPDGVLSLSGLPAAQLPGMQILPPWVGLIELTVDGPEYRDRQLSVPVDLGRTVRVSPLWSEGKPADDIFLRTSQRLAGLTVTHTRRIENDGPIDLTDLYPERTFFEILGQQDTLATHWADLRAPGDHAVDIALDGLPITLEFVGDWSAIGGQTWVELVPTGQAAATLHLGAVQGSVVRTAGNSPGDYGVLFTDGDRNYIGVREITVAEDATRFEVSPAELVPQFLQANPDDAIGADVRVHAEGYPSPLATLTIGPDGRARVIALTHGRFVAQVSSPLHWPDETWFTVDGGQSDQEIRVRRRGALKLELPASKPQLDVISVVDDSSIEAWQGQFPSLDLSAAGPSGQLLLTPLPAGPYLVRVLVGEEWMEHLVQVQPGDPTSFQVPSN